MMQETVDFKPIWTFNKWLKTVVEEKPSEVTKYVDVTVGSRNFSATFKVQREAFGKCHCPCASLSCASALCPVWDIVVDLVDLLIWLGINIFKSLNKNGHLFNETKGIDTLINE